MQQTPNWSFLLKEAQSPQRTMSLSHRQLLFMRTSDSFCFQGKFEKMRRKKSNQSIKGQFAAKKNSISTIYTFRQQIFISTKTIIKHSSPPRLPNGNLLQSSGLYPVTDAWPVLTSAGSPTPMRLFGSFFCFLLPSTEARFHWHLAYVSTTRDSTILTVQTTNSSGGSSSLPFTKDFLCLNPLWIFSTQLLTR